MRELAQWLPDLAPPPGGLARLRRGIRFAAAPRYGWPAAVGACSLALLAVAVLPYALQRHRAHGELTEALRQALQPAIAERIQVHDGVALRLHSGQAGVRLYLVQSSRGAMPPSGD